MASSERRVIQTTTTQWQQVLTPQVTTTNATPTVAYQSQGVIPENRMFYFDIQCVVGTATKDRVSTITGVVGVARAVGGALRNVANPHWQVLQGELKSNEVSLDIGFSGGYWQIIVTGKAGLTLNWIITVRVTRNTT